MDSQNRIPGGLFIRRSRKENRTQLIGYVIERNEILFPIIAVNALDQNFQPQQIYSVIDTGFTGDIMMSPQIIQKLAPQYEGRTQVELADGSVTHIDAYIGLILWHGKSREVRIFEAEGTPLIGMNLLRGSTVNIQTVAGGAVHINEIH